MTQNTIILLAVLISSCLTIYLTNAIINSRLKKKLKSDDEPIAIYILKAAIFLCAGLLINEFVNSFQSLIKILPSSLVGNNLLQKEIMFYSIFWGISLLILSIIVWLSILTYGIVAKGKNVFIEIANNNIGAVILFSGIILAITLVAKSCITPLLDQFIPYPTLPIYH